MTIVYSIWGKRTIVGLRMRTCVDDFGNEVMIDSEAKQRAWYHLGVWGAVTPS